MFSSDLISKSDKFSPCEIINGTKSRMIPEIKRITNTKVVTTAIVFLNFNLLLRNSTKGYNKSVKTTDTIPYTITVEILYMKKKRSEIAAIIPTTLKIPFENSFDVIC